MELNTSELKEKAKTLRAGDKIELSGTVYTSRDAAHKRIKQIIEDMGLSAMIGKGERKPAVVDAIKRNGAVYFCAIGGCGALACQCITECEVIAFEDLGCESVKKLTFDKFPLIVAIDAVGGNIFETGRNRYAEV